MSSPQRLQVKLYFDDSTDIPIKSFIPVFHKWIQNQETDDLLIDVHNYSHMHHGPGILLIAHESDFAIDLADGKTGLIYRRKRNASGTLKEMLILTLQRLAEGARLLKEDKSLPGSVQFRTDEIEIRFLDRLNYPNTPEIYESLKADLSDISGEFFGSESTTLEKVENDSREPMAIRLYLSEPLSLGDLAGRNKTPATGRHGESG